MRWYNMNVEKIINELIDKINYQSLTLLSKSFKSEYEYALDKLNIGILW